MSRNSWLPEGLARLERTQIAPRVQSGSPVGLLLTWAADIRDIKTIPAVLALFRRGMVLLRAKRAIETMVADRKVFVLVPKVESLAALTKELAEAGVRGAALPDSATDVLALREKLGLTQEQLAVRYGLIDAGTRAAACRTLRRRATCVRSTPIRKRWRRHSGLRT